jgi:hypothetical protein
MDRQSKQVSLKAEMNRTLNRIAKVIIALHEEGYNDDFEWHGKDLIWDIQQNRSYDIDEIHIRKICPISSRSIAAAKLVLAIETVDGIKGLLIDYCMNGDCFGEYANKPRH